MKRVYLIAAIIGFIVPTFFVVIESIATGNILLYTNPLATFNGMFANRISSIFAIDLLFTVLVFFIWSYKQSKKHKIKPVYVVWLLTLLFGLAGGFPLFLYLREKTIKNHLKL
ncbi:uncharacterized protein DUF2834 [Aquimarina sp. MAR_2010_214]|uniref:DUF2834 domain-containing protein n=1 Tax=Aquimarina sp. MAR_2010_214 TaxID=1250026 RepID=UPI000C715A17|nr:DUF2834 domain-containing protein [Aquimarina sp. MAR_2010_214]PKV52571.1 uncharacterized protein DUF2834 [Aquimarina sp. MAR_2010_214]